MSQEQGQLFQNQQQQSQIIIDDKNNNNSNDENDIKLNFTNNHKVIPSDEISNTISILFKEIEKLQCLLANHYNIQNKITCMQQQQQDDAHLQFYYNVTKQIWRRLAIIDHLNQVRFTNLSLN
jgi:hypothetical protein